MENRKRNIIRNLNFNMIKFVAQILLQFVLRTALIYLMGAEYLGLNGLFTNIFTFLNLAELGIGSAIVFSMYKPIAEEDTEKIKALQNLYKKFYYIIACIVFTLGLILFPFIKFFIKGDVNANINIYLLFGLYLINTLVGYFSAHKRSLLFAYQRNDIENKIRTICMFCMTLIQIIVLFVFRNYYIFFSINILFTLIECIWIHIASNKLYPEINGKSQKLDAETKKEISKNVTALSMHKIGGAVVFSTDNILISSMAGLIVLGAYSNYYLIISTLISFITLLSVSLKGSVGNLIACSDSEVVYHKYLNVKFIFSVLSAFCTICLIVLFNPFITLWTGGGVYLFDFSTVVLLCISFYLTQMRSGVGIFKECAGLFWQNRIAPIFESIINLTLSIVLGLFMGINGIILGTIASTIFVPLWVEPMILYKHYFKKNVWTYFKQYIIDFLIMITVGVICYLVCSFIPDGGIWLLLAKFATCIPLCAVLLIIAYLPTKQFKQTCSMCKNLLKRNKETQD